ncbi:MAG: peroxidase family protein [Nitrospiraceae bacterium]
MGQAGVFHRIVVRLYRVVNRVIPWHRLPKLLGVGNLVAIRHDLRCWNLHSTSALAPPLPQAPPFTEHHARYRTADGTYNDLRSPNMGCAGSAFGRNLPVEQVHPAQEEVLVAESPSPRDISLKLMTRKQFIPATSLNVLASAWIQFEVHDWFAHKQEDRADVTLRLKEDDDWESFGRNDHVMNIRRTVGCPAGARALPNTETHWWDASQVYGSSQARQAELRDPADATIRTDARGRLPSMQAADPELAGIDLTGFNDNYWVGLSLLHTLFSREHNAVCDALQRTYPSLTHEARFQIARLVTSALIAKIHMIEWTPALLQHPTLATGMRGNWWGMLGETFRKRFGRVGPSEVLSGIPGSPTDHHGVPYALTEEFVAVYRLHPLIPDDYRFLFLDDPHKSVYKTFPEIQGSSTRALIDEIGIENVWYSFGVAHPGAITLGNFPRFLQRFKRIKQLDGQDEFLDLAALDVFRDRERAVPRYNAFRRMLRLTPIGSFAELNAEWGKTLEELYDGDVERLDLMVGLFAETPPKGFAISETAFRIFTVMAPRRVKSDRFLTDDFRPEVYTPLGMDWVQNTTFKDVVLRHYPSLAPALSGVANPFLPWRHLHDEC